MRHKENKESYMCLVNVFEDYVVAREVNYKLLMLRSVISVNFLIEVKIAYFKLILNKKML